MSAEAVAPSRLPEPWDGASRRLIATVREHEPIEVPVRELLDAAGQLNLSKDAHGEDYFAVFLKKGRVQLQARGWVGVIPITEHVAVRVVPRVPVGNLLRMLRIAAYAPRQLSFMREYATEEQWVNSLLDFYAAALLRHIEEVGSNGLLTRYERQEENSAFPHGRILVGPTLARVRPRGIRHRAIVSYFDRTADNAPNRCLKYALWFLAQHYASEPERTGAARRLRQRINGLYNLFEGVALDHRLGFLNDPEVAATRPLPTLRAYYRDALDVALAIIDRHAVQIEVAGGALKMPSLVLNMNDVFESYLRNSLRAYAMERGWATAVLDGNGEGKKPLFDTQPSEPAKPDIVLRAPDGAHPAVVEIKNVPVQGLSQRDSINQALAYALSFRCKRVVLAHPRGFDQPFAGMRFIGRVGDIELHQYIADLDASDLTAAEHAFGMAVEGLASVS